MKKRTSDLLAAYADGGLGGGEAAEVEALLAQSPEARAELEAIRRLLADARSAARSGVEPDWDAMAREIRRACEEAPSPGLLRRARAWFTTPKMVIGGAAAAACAVAITLGVQRGGDEPIATGEGR